MLCVLSTLGIIVLIELLSEKGVSSMRDTDTDTILDPKVPRQTLALVLGFLETLQIYLVKHV